MPKSFCVPEDHKRAGIAVTWTPTAGRLDIFGWYDSCVGIGETVSMSLREFFDRLGITERDVRKAFSDHGRPRMRILAIDPGNVQSAWLIYDTEARQPLHVEGGSVWGAIWPNPEVLGPVSRAAADDGVELLAVEMIASYGMPVGRTVFDTCVWTGRFIQAWDGPYRLVYRQDVKLHLCGSARARDANVRQALIDRFPATGGGKTPQIGTKGKPGPLYGLKADLWAALGVAITAAETEARA